MNKLSSVLKKVIVVRQQLAAACVGQPEPILRVMDLVHVVSEVYGLKIEMFKVDFRGVHLKGNLERYADGRARILIRADLSEPDLRLVAVKELCHLFIDEEDDWSTAGTDTIDEYLDVSTEGDDEESKPPAPAIHSEFMAMMAATELVYPREYREADLGKMAAGDATLASIALEHDIPAYVVRHAFENSDVIERGYAIIEEEAALKAAE